MRFSLRSDAGASLVEFAIVAPVLAFLLIGLIDLGRYEYYSILAANAARAGVLYGAQGVGTAVDTAGIKNAVIADAGSLAAWTTANAITVNTLCSTSGGSPGPMPCSGSNVTYYVQVIVNAQFSPLVKYVGFSGPVTISGSAIQRLSAQ